MEILFYYVCWFFWLAAALDAAETAGDGHVGASLFRTTKL